MLDVRDLSVHLDAQPVVVGADLEVADGSVLAVLGPSGCGKSTLLRAVAGLEPLAAGSVSWDGTDLTTTPAHRRGFALMFQDGQLFDHLTVARNVAYALRLRRGSTQQGGRGSRRSPDIADRVAELLDLVGLPSYGERMPATLSGGERQRVALARSLAVRPRLLLLDEPLSALDAGLRERLAGDLQRILREAGTTALWVTHDHDEAFAVADRLAVMRAGRIVQQGDIARVWAAPADRDIALFLGYASVLADEPARRLLAAAGVTPGSTAAEAGAGVALRRSALAVDPAGPLRGRVVESRLTPEQVRLRVDVPDIGEMDAVAALDIHPGPGEVVRLRVDRTRLALVDEP